MGADQQSTEFSSIGCSVKDSFLSGTSLRDASTGHPSALSILTEGVTYLSRTVSESLASSFDDVGGAGGTAADEEAFRQRLAGARWSQRSTSLGGIAHSLPRFSFLSEAASTGHLSHSQSSLQHQGMSSHPPSDMDFGKSGWFPWQPLAQHTTAASNCGDVFAMDGHRQSGGTGQTTSDWGGSLNSSCSSSRSSTSRLNNNRQPPATDLQHQQECKQVFYDCAL